MKQGMTLSDLAREVRHQQQRARDFHAPTNALQCLPSGDIEMFLGQERLELSPTLSAMRQIGTHCGIPATYFDKMKEQAPELLAQNVNHWFKGEHSVHMIRTLDNRLRAFLGKKYRPLDNADCIAATIPILEQFGGQVESCQLTETKLYLKAVVPGKSIELKAEGVEWGKGHNPIHVLRPGIVISNSETGHGSVSVQPGVHERHCSNLMVMSEQAMRKLHVQKAATVEDGAAEYLTDETRRKQDEAFWATVQDLTRAALDGRIFDDYVRKIQATMNVVIPQPTATVELVAKKFSLSADEKDSVLNRLINSGEPTQFGLQAAITSAASDVESYDRSTELERIGGQIIELKPTEWQTLAVAA